MDIHENARSNIMLKSKELINELQELPPIEYPHYNIKEHNVSVIDDEDVIKKMIINEKKGFSFYCNGKRYGFQDEKFILFKKNVEKIWNSLKRCCPISIEYIEERYKEWVRDVKNNVQSSNIVEYIESSYENDKLEYTILIPIPYTFIEKDFQLGKVHFKSFDISLIDNFLREENEYNDLRESIQNKYSGHMVGIFIGCGDSYFVQSEAYKHLNDCLSIIRMFSPANLNCELISIADALSNGINSKNFFAFNTEDKKFQYVEGNVDTGFYSVIPKNVIDRFFNEEYEGFKFFLELEPSDYSKKVFKAINVYSRHTLKKEIFDKILYVLSSLEMVFLINNTESIQQNLSERIALYVGENIASRKKIISMVKKIYQIRSRSVHHGKMTINDVEEVNNFLVLAWVTFRKLMYDARYFTKLIDLIESIENMKLA